MNRILNCVESDLTLLAELEKKSFNYNQLSYARMRYFLKQANCIFLVVRQENQIAGYILGLLKKNATNLRVYSVAVDQKFRNQGMANELFKALEKIACQKKLAYLSLEVRQDCPHLIKLYEKFGYKKERELLDYYSDGGTAIKMKKYI